MAALTECWQTLAIAGLRTERFVQFGNKRIPTTAVKWAIGFAVTTIITVQAIICVKHYDQGFQALLHPIHLVLALSSMLFIYLSLVVKVEEITQLICYLQAVVERRSRDANRPRQIYQKRNAFNQKVVRLYCTYLWLIIVLMYSIPAASPFLYAIFGVPPPHLWYLPLSVDQVMPFNTQTSIGFAATMAIELCIGWPFLIGVLAFQVIYFSVATYIQSAVEDMAYIMASVNEAILKRSPAKDGFREFIELNWDCLRLMEMLDDIISVTIFVQVSACAMELAVSLFQLEYDVTALSLDFIFDVNELVYVLGINFILSFFLTALTTSAQQIGNIVYDSSWYKLPIHDQFIVQMIMRRAQKPFELKGMGVFVCSLQTFLTLIRSAGSFFMVFRQLKTDS